VGASAWPEAEAGFREVRLEARLQYLKHGLLDQSVQDRRDAQRSDTATRFRDFDLPNRLGLVSAAEQLLLDAGPFPLDVGR